jgi:site-specific recombinase XerD
MVENRNWNEKNRRVQYVKNGNLPTAKVNAMNLVLDSIANRAQAIFHEYQVSGEFLTKKDFIFKMTSGTERTDFIAFLDRGIKQYALEVEANTIKHVRRAQHLFKEFGKHVYMHELDIDFIKQFDAFLKRKNLAPNSRRKVHTTIKMFVAQACEKYDLKNPYTRFKMPHAETNKVFLITSEVKQLKNLLVTNELTQPETIALQKYLFSCHCGGQRISDVQQIGAKSIVNDELVFIPKKTKRTNKQVRIPFKKEYYQWVQYPDADVFWEVTSDQHINRQLKTIQQKAGIKKKLDFKTARHTFATGYLAAGGSVEVLQQILRHSKIETTMVYVHITDQRIKEEAGKVRMFE